MFSLKTSVFFFACIAVAVAFPHFFNIGHRNREGERGEPGEPGEQQQYRYAARPYNQQVGQSSVFSDAGVDVASASNSAEDAGAAGSLGGDGLDDADGADADGASELDSPDSPDTRGAVVAGGAGQAGNNAGDTSSTPSPNVLGGGPGLIVNTGKGSSPGVKFGIAFMVLTVVGLAAGGAFYAYRKRRIASYGSRF